MALIDEQALRQAYDRDGFYALQLEVGDACNQSCIYCYMNALPDVKNTLSDEDIESILRDSKRLGITAIEWLGGEPLLRDGIFEHMKLASKLGFRNNIWTGGLPLADADILESCIAVARPGLISVHVSTVDPRLYETLHPGRSARDLETILAAVQRLVDSGYPPENVLNSVTFTGLQPADDMIRTFDYFLEKFGIKPSLNVYHTYTRPGTPPGELERFIPSKSDVAKVYRRYAEIYDVKHLPMNCVNKEYCSTTLAVLSNGAITPCATIREPALAYIHDDGRSFHDIVQNHRDGLIFKHFKDIENRPKICQRCAMNDECWGCRSRAHAAGLGLDGPDPRCFRSRDIARQRVGTP